MDKTEASAKALIRYLTILSLIDSDGLPTEIARKWRIDESHGEVCEAMLRSGFPVDIADAVPNGAESEVIVNLFMARGLGEGSAKILVKNRKQGGQRREAATEEEAR